MLKCTINGKQLEVKPGTTIIQAYQQVEENIAHYCWHPGLSVAGVCRMCFVEIEGNPRLQLACNTPITDGMVVNNTSKKVEESVQWVLEFHLINHPLDCPICDQAGECGLQEYYMKHGQYDPGMGEKKVKKRKVVDLGERVVLDTERCILCSRCVRFTDEVTKTHELGIFNRGDHSEIATHADAPLNNNYSLNTVDICPVGALTSKDFRFRQRVWFLKDFESVCSGCSTGCNTRVYYNENGLYRVKPVYNESVNGYWMCDKGRDIYKFINLESRLTQASLREGGVKVTSAGQMAKIAAQQLGDIKKQHGADSVALVLTGQYFSEEYDACLSDFTTTFSKSHVYHWINNQETFDSFDGILLRGDRNPNTVGLLRALEQKGLNKTWKDLVENIENGSIKAIVVAGPENLEVYPDLGEKLELFAKVSLSVWMGSSKHPSLEKMTISIPMKSYVEKSGTFVNHAGVSQNIKKGVTIVSSALTLNEASALLSGKELSIDTKVISKGEAYNMAGSIV
ncbi:MAG: NADH dehydrogenase subunit [Bdellovibrionales bacterium CG10_big_fil_rev_8_21_14_0_10_45_34]|nr:MAG: NADH dehydrogenase subunit [Bdellovibrionales bacterium CG10_big_fil_rev_8_21_14_0_10_45_34]